MPRITGLEMPLPVVTWATPGTCDRASMMLVDEMLPISRAASTVTGVGEFLIDALPVRPVTTTSLRSADFSLITKLRLAVDARSTVCEMLWWPKYDTCTTVSRRGKLAKL